MLWVVLIDLGKYLRTMLQLVLTKQNNVEDRLKFIYYFQGLSSNIKNIKSWMNPIEKMFSLSTIYIFINIIAILGYHNTKNNKQFFQKNGYQNLQDIRNNSVAAIFNNQPLHPCYDKIIFKMTIKIITRLTILIDVMKKHTNELDENGNNLINYPTKKQMKMQVQAIEQMYNIMKKVEKYISSICTVSYNFPAQCCVIGIIQLNDYHCLKFFFFLNRIQYIFSITLKLTLYIKQNQKQRQVLREYRTYLKKQHKLKDFIFFKQSLSKN